MPLSPRFLEGSSLGNAGGTPHVGLGVGGGGGEGIKVEGEVSGSCPPCRQVAKCEAQNRRGEDFIPLFPFLWRFAQQCWCVLSGGG